jgi:hypothetical protein
MMNDPKTTRAKNPPDQPSDEADKQQLRMAHEEGKAYQKSLHYMVEQVADGGGTQRAGEYIVGWAQERAEGMWHLHDGKLIWHEPPPGDNCHLEISVADAADERFIPYLDVRATLIAKDGAEIGPFEIPFVWHPGLYHYGRNLQVPGEGAYTLRVHIAPPTFMRHDHHNGRRNADPVEVVFSDIQVKPGREDPEEES